MTSQEGSLYGKGKFGVENVSSSLSDDLVEKILAMVPFPQVFKARTLSKSWLARFSPVSSQENEVNAHLATWFQEKVDESSTNWKTLCPVFVLDCQQGFIGYDRITNSWPTMPSLSFLPSNALSTSRSELQIDGSLVLTSELDFNWETASKRVASMSVGNVLNQRWKELPHLLVAEDESYVFEKLVSNTSSQTYNVIVFYRGRGYYRAQIYDSKTNSWTGSSKILVKDFSDLSRPTYFNGVLYMVVGQSPRNLLAYNVEAGTFEELEILGDTVGTYDVDLVICKDNLLMTVKKTVLGKTVQILKIDLRSKKLVEVSRGPPAALDLGELGTGSVSDKSWKGGRATSDGDCIFFPQWNFHQGMVVYNVHTDEWSHLSFPEGKVGVHDSMPKLDVTCFQPSLNTFLVV